MVAWYTFLRHSVGHCGFTLDAQVTDIELSFINTCRVDTAIEWLSVPRAGRQLADRLVAFLARRKFSREARTGRRDRDAVV